LAETQAQAQELISLAEKKGVRLMVGHLYRFNNAIDTVKQMMSDNSLGDVREIKIHWINDEYAFQPDFDKRVADRDVITDLAVHPFDIINYLFGKNPDYIFCTGGSYHLKNKLEVTTIIGKIDSTMIEIGVSWVTPPKTRSLVVVGDKKSLFVDCVQQTIQVYEKGVTKNLPIESNNTIATELSYFLDLMESKKQENKASGSVGNEILKMLDATYQALKKNG